MNIAIVDIEADNLLLDLTTIHCIAVKVNDTPTVCYTSRPIKGSSGSIKDCLDLLKTMDKVVFHNGIKFDIPAIRNITKVDLWDYCEIDDTLLMSQLLYPNLLMIDSNNKHIPKELKGSHSLKAWGYRLHNYKDHYEDWSKLTEEMVTYCKQDVEVTSSLYKKLMSKNPSEMALYIEYNFARIIQRQEEFGVLFDVEEAKKLHIDMLQEEEEAFKHLKEVFKPLRTWFPKSYPKIPYKQDGSKSQVLLNQEALGYQYNNDGEWGIYKDVEFDPSKSAHIVRWIEELYGKQDWVLTEKGNPKTGAEFLEPMIGQYDWSFPLLKYLAIKKLLGQLATGKQAWFKKLRADNRLHGEVNTIGAVSRRCTHNNPNLAQVPSPNPKGNLSKELKDFKAYLGKRSRKLFIAPKGYKLMGIDAEGLELRTLSHYLARYDNGMYGEAVVNGDKSKGTDIHTLNQKSAGLPTRDDAKTFIYAFLYGAGDKKIGSIIGKGAKEGRSIKLKFFTKLPALKYLSESVLKAVKTNGYLLSLDKNKYFIRSEHMALNTLLQGAGAVLCKLWCVLTDKAIQEEGYIPREDYEFVLNVHDEFTIECKEEIAQHLGEIASKCIELAGEKLGLRIKLEALPAVGDNWYDIH